MEMLWNIMAVVGIITSSVLLLLVLVYFGCDFRSGGKIDK